MPISAFVLLYCLCAVVLWPADTAPAGAEPAATTTAEHAVSTEPAAPARSTVASSVHVRARAADATDSAGRGGSAADGEVNVSVEQTLDALLGQVADTSGSVLHQHSAELNRRMDDLSAEVHRGTRLATDASAAILRLLNGQTRLEDIHQGLQEVLRGQARTETELDALRHGQAQLQTEHTRIIDMLKLNQIPFNQPNQTVQFCPAGWSRGGSSCFFVMDGTSTWSDADSSCKAKHPRATLASVHADTKEYVRQLRTHIWIGLRRGNDGWSWSWTDGTTLDFTDWRDGEPSNNGGSEDCVYYHFSDYGAVGWNDAPCKAQIGRALCQLLKRDIRSTAD